MYVIDNFYSEAFVFELQKITVFNLKLLKHNSRALVRCICYKNQVNLDMPVLSIKVTEDVTATIFLKYVLIS